MLLTHTALSPHDAKTTAAGFCRPEEDFAADAVPARMIRPPRRAKGAVQEAIEYGVVESLEFCHDRFIASVGVYPVEGMLGRNWRRHVRPVAKIAFSEPVCDAATERFALDQATRGADAAGLTSAFVRQVNERVGALLPPHREVLVLFSGATRTYGEVAEMLGVSVARLKARIRRAREALRRELARSSPPAALCG